MTPPASDPSSAVRAAYAEYRAYVRRALAACGVPSADVEDLTHEVFVVLLRRIDEQRDPAALRSWLFQTARRIASNHRRSAKRAEQRIARLPRLGPEPDSEDRLARADAAAFINRFLDTLDPDARDLFLLSEVEGVRGIEVAAKLALNPKTAAFFLAFIPQFVDPAGAVALQFALLGTISVVLNTAVDALVVLWAARIRDGAARRPGLIRRLRQALQAL